MEAEEDQSDISKEGRNKEKDTYESAYGFYGVRESTLNAFKCVIFQIKAAQGKGLQIINAQQMIQKLPIAYAQVKAGDISKSLLNEIRQTIYSLYQAKEITKNGYNMN